MNFPRFFTTTRLLEIAGCAERAKNPHFCSRLKRELLKRGYSDRWNRERGSVNKEWSRAWMGDSNSDADKPTNRENRAQIELDFEKVLKILDADTRDWDATSIVDYAIEMEQLKGKS